MKNYRIAENCGIFTIEKEVEVKKSFKGTETVNVWRVLDRNGNDARILGTEVAEYNSLENAKLAVTRFNTAPIYHYL